MMDEHYAPFPEAELRDLAASLREEAVYYRDRGDRKEFAHWSDGETTLRNALLSFAALRERCLLAETENAQLKRQIAARAPLLPHESGSLPVSPLESAGDEENKT